MEKTYFDSLFFLFGIPIAYIAMAIVCMINQKVRDKAGENGGKGGKS